MLESLAVVCKINLLIYCKMSSLISLSKLYLSIFLISTHLCSHVINPTNGKAVVFKAETLLALFMFNAVCDVSCLFPLLSPSSTFLPLY